MQRLLEARHVVGKERKRDGDEALHVGRAAAVEPLVLLQHGERVAVPRLAFDRNHVAVAGQDEPAFAARPQRCEQVCLAALVVECQAHVRIEAAQQLAHEVDQLEIGLAAHRRKTDEPADHLDAAGAVAGRLHCDSW
jgi:hypothetical protein